MHHSACINFANKATVKYLMIQLDVAGSGISGDIIAI